MPVVSVIIPTCDRPGMVRAAIESVLAASSEAITLEILLIDDSTNGDTRVIAEDYPARYIEGPKRGPSAARNAGLAAASGNYVTFLDDDDTWAPGNLKTQIGLLEANPEFGGTCSRVILTNSDGAIISPPYPDPPFASGALERDFLSYIPQVASLVVRRDIAKGVGLFDTSLQGGEDWDWALRLAKATSLAFVPEVALYWRMHDTHRLDGAGNRRIEDVAWRRYLDVMKVARAHVSSNAGLSSRERLRIILKHKGHYPQLFMRYAAGYRRTGDWTRASICVFRAARASPLHFLKYLITP